MDNAIPSNIAVEITLNCETIEEKNQVHRIWITRRDAEVITPDHASEGELIVKALGGKMLNPCSYWRDVPRLFHGGKVDNAWAPQDISSWEITNTAFWDKSVVWIFLSALLGKAATSQLNAGQALEHAKIYQKYRNKESFALLEELEYLQTPWKRSGGYRKTTNTTNEELELMMKTGLPINRVASAIALGLTHDEIASAGALLRKNNLPVDYILNLAYLIPAERLVKLLAEMSSEQIKNLPVALAEFQKDSSTVLDSDIEKYFLEKGIK